LTRVAAIRICLPASRSLEPFIDWPSDLRDKVLGDIVMLEGGHECDGRHRPLRQSACVPRGQLRRV
jgi:hypothetical protein